MGIGAKGPGGVEGKTPVADGSAAECPREERSRSRSTREKSESHSRSQLRDGAKKLAPRPPAPATPGPASPLLGEIAPSAAAAAKIAATPRTPAKPGPAPPPAGKTARGAAAAASISTAPPPAAKIGLTPAVKPIALTGGAGPSDATALLTQSEIDVELDAELASLPASMPPSIPPKEVEAMARFGRYELLGRLATGGMAEIYLARESSAGGASRHVVVKIIRPLFASDDDFEEMFLNEGRVAMGLSHPNICHLYEFGHEHDRYFIAMEWVNGVTLKQLVRDVAERGDYIPTPILVRIAAQVAEALDSAHHAKDSHGRPLGIVHRDVSPHNIMIGYDGVVKLLDFGVAKAKRRGGPNTVSGTIKGKFAYIAPEQAMGREVDGRADVFSLGVCLWEALSVRRLFKRESEFETLHAIVDADVPQIREVRPDIHEALAAVVHRALRADLGARFATAGAMEGALQQYLVARGEMVNRSRVAEFMRGVYAGAMAAGPTLETGPDVLEKLGLERLSLPPTLPPAAELAAPTASRPRWLVPALAAAVLVIGGALVLALTSGGEEEPVTGAQGAEGVVAEEGRPEGADPGMVEATVSEVVGEAPLPTPSAEIEPRGEGPGGTAEAASEEGVADGESAEEALEAERERDRDRRRRRRRTTMTGFVTDPGF